MIDMTMVFKILSMGLVVLTAILIVKTRSFTYLTMAILLSSSALYIYIGLNELYKFTSTMKLVYTGVYLLVQFLGFLYVHTKTRKR